MTKKFLSTLTLLLFLSTAPVAAQVNIGVLDIQKVLSEAPGMEQIQQELNTFVSQKQEELRSRTADFQDSVAQYQDNQASMSQEQRTQREEELAAMEQELQQFQQNLQTQIQQYRQQLLSPVYEDIDSAIASVAEENGLDFVLNKSTSRGEEIVRYVAENRLNITEEVIQQINSQSN